jgi:acyl-lipid (7-3)-desaturase (Delta-4 desaturase)
MAPNKTTESSFEQAKASKPSPMNDYTVQVDDHVYDTKALAKIHPGGELFVKAFSGRDATEAFLSYHRKPFPHDRMTDSLVGKAAALKNASSDDEYLELCKKIEQVLPRSQAFATPSYFLKVAVILSITFGLEAYMHLHGEYKWYLTGFLGFIYALVGLNIQHDANHGAISRYPWVNRVLGLSQNWIGGSAVDWIHQHVVQHHINPNDVENDPDIVGNDLLRFNPVTPLFKIQAMQHLYLFVLLAFFGFTYIADSLKHNLEGFHKTSFSKLLKTNRTFEEATIALFAFRWIVLPLVIRPSVYTLLNIAPLFLVGGYYLSFFFVISHNFEGVHLHAPEFTSKVEQSFMRKQVVTAANVGGAWLACLNGGLNYQIEHHLFPRISHVHYPTIAPIVREFCKSKGIPYVHFPTIMENVVSCSKHMYQLGHSKTSSNYIDGKGKKAK